MSLWDASQYARVLTAIIFFQHEQDAQWRGWQESRIESECGGKIPLANAKNCTELRDNCPSTTKNRTFLTWAIPDNLARLSAPRVPLPVNSGRLHAQEALGAKKQFTPFPTSVSSRIK
jgi:hypothetical protein